MAQPPPWRVVIADDEPPARRSLRLLLDERPAFEIVAECGNGESAIETVATLRPDLLLLDVQMPGLDGFGVVEALDPDTMPAVVFVTAYDQYALRAFEAHAVDYLLKPFSDERFGAVIAHAERQLAGRTAGRLEQQIRGLLRDHASRARQLVVRDGGRIVVVPWADIDWIGAEDYCIRIYAGPSRPLIRKSLQALLALLDPALFVRIHRSTAVNLARVREVRPLDSGDAQVVLADGTRLRVSRGYRAAFDTRLRALG